MSKLTEYIDKIKQNVKANNMNEIEIIRYVYIDLGRMMDFDLNYTFGNRKEKDQIYNKHVDDDELSHIIEVHTSICKSLSYLVKRILNEFDIECNVERVFNEEKRKFRKAYI